MQTSKRVRRPSTRLKSRYSFASRPDLDQVLDPITRLEDGLFPPEPRDQRLGVGGAPDALDDDLPHGELDPHRVRLPEISDAEDDAAVLPVEEAPDDVLDLLADGAVDLGRGEDAFSMSSTP